MPRFLLTSPFSFLSITQSGRVQVTGSDLATATFPFLFYFIDNYVLTTDAKCREVIINLETCLCFPSFLSYLSALLFFRWYFLNIWFNLILNRFQSLFFYFEIGSKLQLFQNNTTISLKAFFS